MIRRLLFVAMLLAAGVSLRAQAPDGVLSPSEVDALRDTAYTPVDRIKAYIKILDSREKQINGLLAKRHGAEFASDMHDAIDGIGAIADELNDNLDSYRSHHRDLRKVLLKLVDSSDSWSTALRAPANDDHYNVVRKIALDTIKDTRELALQMEAEQTTYFAEHPEAAKAEKARADDPHTPQ